VSAWILSLLLFLAPPERMAAQPAFPGWEEDTATKRARYAQIAEDIAVVVTDSTEAPAVGGKNGRARTAALIVAIAWKESAFARDVDLGPACYRGRDGRSPRCDGGAAASIFQIRIGAGTTVEGWKQADLFADRKKAVRAALHLVRRSVNACSKYGALAALRSYASGSCERGHAASAARVQLAQRLLATLPPPKDLP
jgi:hypothetical protein